MADETVTMSTGKTQDGSPTGTIRWEIDNVSELDNAFSPKVEVHGIPWYVGVNKEDGDPSFLGVYLHGYENDSVLWSIEVDAQFTLFNKDSSMNTEKKYNKTFSHATESWGFDDYISWKELVDKEKGFIKDDKITIEVEFTLRNIKGIRNDLSFDFTDSNDPFHDVSLIMNGKKIHVSKQYLAIHSPVFRAMFYGEFSEKDKKEIEMKDIEYNDFSETMHVLYPTGKKIKDDNAEALLKVGDRFQMKIIIDQVEQFLINSSNRSVPAKLKLSGDYRLVELQGDCLDSFEYISDVIDLKDSEEYDEFSDATKLSLLEKIMKLSKE